MGGPKKESASVPCVLCVIRMTTDDCKSHQATHKQAPRLGDFLDRADSPGKNRSSRGVVRIVPTVQTRVSVEGMELLELAVGKVLEKSVNV